MHLHLQTCRKRVNLVLILLLCACTPALNWRDVRLESADGSALKAALPCKPDNATRKQQLGDIQVDLSMMGCVANDDNFYLVAHSFNQPVGRAQSVGGLASGQLWLMWRAKPAIHGCCYSFRRGRLAARDPCHAHWCCHPSTHAVVCQANSHGRDAVPSRFVQQAAQQ